MNTENDPWLLNQRIRLGQQIQFTMDAKGTKEKHRSQGRPETRNCMDSYDISNDGTKNGCLWWPNQRIQWKAHLLAKRKVTRWISAIFNQNILSTSTMLLKRRNWKLNSLNWSSIMTKVSKSGEIVMKFEMLCDVNANFTEITPHLSRFFYFSRFFGKAASTAAASYIY